MQPVRSAAEAFSIGSAEQPSLFFRRAEFVISKFGAISLVAVRYFDTGVSFPTHFDHGLHNALEAAVLKRSQYKN